MFFKVRRKVLLFLPTNSKIIASLLSQILMVFKKINILWKICTYFAPNNWASILINLKRRDAWCNLFGIKIKMQANLYWSQLLMGKDFCIAKILPTETDLREFTHRENVLDVYRRTKLFLLRNMSIKLPFVSAFSVFTPLCIT